MKKTKAKKTEISFPRQSLQAEVDAASVNPEARTVDVVWSTGEKIRFYDWEIGEYFLTLGLETENVRLDFARSGAPVLDAHSKWSVQGVMGVIDSIDVDGSRGTATLRFSKRDDVEPVWQDIVDGVLRFVSVGTQLHKLEDITEDDDKVKHYRAVDHEPLEISLAPIPRDRGAVMQSEEDGGEERFPVEIIEQSAEAAPKTEGHRMAKRTTRAAKEPAIETNETEVTQAETVEATPSTPEANQTVSQPTESDPEAVARQAVAAERERGASIRRVVNQAGLDADFASRLIDEGATIDQARTEILDHLAEQGDKTAARTHVTIGRDETDTIRQSVASAILHRINPSSFALEERAGEFVGMSLVEINRELLANHGIRTRGESKLRIAELSLHSTSDFPEILANVAGKTLRAAYEAQPRSFVSWCRQATLPDFKQVSRTQIGEAPQLQKVNESGEFKRGTIGEGAEKYQLATYGRVVGFTRQSMINDDLNAFSRLITAFAVSAANLQSDVVYDILAANPAMSDGETLFSSAHGNVAGTPGALSVTSLGVGRSAMRLQKGLDGVTPINVMAKTLLVPTSLETAAEQLVTSIVANDTVKVNPFSGKLQVVTEPRLDAQSATRWHLAADPNAIDTIEYAFLEGQTGPFMETRQGFDVDGMEFKARLDFAAKAIDHRGLYRNNGA